MGEVAVSSLIRTHRSHAGVLLAVAMGVTGACSGQIGEPKGFPGGAAPTGGTTGGPGTSGGTGSTGTAGGTGADGGNPPEILPPFAPAAPALARLTAAQYAHVMGDLFGAPTQVPELELDTRPYLFSVIGASTTTVSEHGVDLYGQAAYAITAAVFGDTSRRSMLVPCSVASPLDAACLARFIQDFGL